MYNKNFHYEYSVCQLIKHTNFEKSFVQKWQKFLKWIELSISTWITLRTLKKDPTKAKKLTFRRFVDDVACPNESNS